MDLQKKFEITPFPVEKEFQIASVRHRISDVSREDLEVFLVEALDTMARLAHQVRQLSDYVGRLGGKTE